MAFDGRRGYRGKSTGGVGAPFCELGPAGTDQAIGIFGGHLDDAILSDRGVGPSGSGPRRSLAHELWLRHVSLQREGKRHDATAADPAIGWLHPGDAAHRGRVANGPAGVSAERSREEPSGEADPAAARRRRNGRGSTGCVPAARASRKTGRRSRTHESRACRARPHRRLRAAR